MSEKNIRIKIQTLHETGTLSNDDLLEVIQAVHLNHDDESFLFECALNRRREHYDTAVYMRGLIEFTNYCKQNCAYCGIRRGNPNADRYRLSKVQIMECCAEGYALGYRTFVLQGGEDAYYDDDRLVDLVKTIKSEFPDCAVTLSVGERPYESYQVLRAAGADRYLLRHETASKALYKKHHPGMSFENRIECLYALKKLGYQVGAGFMVGLPGQTDIDLTADLVFLKALEPEMVGIGPFIAHDETPLAGSPNGTVRKTCHMLALTRLLLPKALIPATTAMGTLDPSGREQALRAGANVVMPNLSPTNVREKYALYNGKICTGDEAAQCRNCIESRIESAGFKVDMGRGDFKDERFLQTSERLTSEIVPERLNHTYHDLKTVSSGF